MAGEQSPLIDEVPYISTRRRRENLINKGRSEGKEKDASGGYLGGTCGYRRYQFQAPA